MSISKENAIFIYNQCQHCIKELDQSIAKIKELGLDSENFMEARLFYAEAMGAMVSLCESQVYKDFPDLRPYSLE